MITRALSQPQCSGPGLSASTSIRTRQPSRGRSMARTGRIAATGVREPHRGRTRRCPAPVGLADGCFRRRRLPAEVSAGAVAGALCWSVWSTAPVSQCTGADRLTEVDLVGDLVVPGTGEHSGIGLDVERDRDLGVGDDHAGPENPPVSPPWHPKRLTKAVKLEAIGEAASPSRSSRRRGRPLRVLGGRPVRPGGVDSSVGSSLPISWRRSRSQPPPASAPLQQR